MDGITLGLLIGAGAVALMRNRRERAKAAIGWAARQSGWIAGRIQADLLAATRLAREEFEHERRASAARATEGDAAEEKPAAANAHLVKASGKSATP